MDSEHKNPDCKGRWIDIGTLSDPWRQKCSGCRATRQKPMDDGDEADVIDAMNAADIRHIQGLSRLRADLIKDGMDPSRWPDDPAEAIQREPEYSSGMRMLGGVFIILAVCAAVSIMIYAWVKGGGS